MWAGKTSNKIKIRCFPGSESYKEVNKKNNKKNMTLYIQ